MAKNKELATIENNGGAIITKQDVEALKEQRKLLKDFVSSQLVEAKFGDDETGEGDYGVIPGTKKRSLFKQGAEKLLRVFQLGCKMELVDKTIDKEANFALIIYKAKIYRLNNPDVTIAECEGSANSQEVKYKGRTVWRNIFDKNGKKTDRKEQVTEITPVYDVLNTLIKMSQKRAVVGATILATGASEYFTHDMLEDQEPKDPTNGDQPENKEQTEPTEKSAPPVCCDKKMMISKYPNRDGERKGKLDYYCINCKTTQAREPQ